MTTVTKFTTPTAAGAEVHARAVALVSQTHSYKDALRVVLDADPELAKAYAEPSKKPQGKTPTPAVPVTGGDEQEVLDWIMRSL
jgi:hypothetical protein